MREMVKYNEIRLVIREAREGADRIKGLDFSDLVTYEFRLVTLKYGYERRVYLADFDNSSFVFSFIIFNCFIMFLTTL